MLEELAERTWERDILAQRMGHRGVEFNIQRLDDWRWEWAVKPNNEEGVHLCGIIHGSEGTAAAIAVAAIDGWLAGKAS